jgi:putative transposase
LSERRACRALKLHRTCVRYQPVKRADEDEITARIIELACDYGRYGYRRITAMLRLQGYWINHKRVERIWRELGLKVPKKQPKRRRLWLNDGSCIRLRPEYINHVWSYDFVFDRLSNGRQIKWLNIIDEHTRECLASIPRRSWRYTDVIEVLSGLFVGRGCPEYLRSDNGSEFTTSHIRKWLRDIGVTTLYIEPGSPWENGYCESFNSKMRDEFLNIEIFDTMFEAQVLTKMWVETYNTIRPHSSIGYNPPAPQALRNSA